MNMQKKPLRIRFFYVIDLLSRLLGKYKVVPSFLLLSEARDARYTWILLPVSTRTLRYR